MTARRRMRTVLGDGDDDNAARRPGGRHVAGQGGAVPLYVIERNFAEQLDPNELDQEGILLVNEDVGIRWLYSFLSADRKKTYCLYEAPNPDALREAAARLGIPADEVVAVERIEPAPTG